MLFLLSGRDDDPGENRSGSILIQRQRSLVAVNQVQPLADVAQSYLTAGSRSLGTLVDSYILPMVRDGSTDFSSLWGYLSKLACIFAVGMISSFLFMFLMVKVSQGTQKHIRDEMFAHMQTLPLRYFDTNTAGNIMSRYTSDIDTLRQMISQSIPQCASSMETIVVVFVGMLQTSWVLTIVMLFTVTGIVFVTMKVAGKSAKYFVGQQQSLGALNGYVEEIGNG